MFKIKSDWLEENWNTLVDALRDAEQQAIIHWTMQYSVVVDEGGKICTRERVGGSNSYYADDTHIHTFFYGPERPEDQDNIDDIAWDTTHDVDAVERYNDILEDLYKSLD